MSFPVAWVLLSQEAVASVSAALEPDNADVRDELGFLDLHQAFADRFFPGTSVLHTRLRYALFIPWLMTDAAAKGIARPDARFREMERVLTERLARAGNTGVIGGQVMHRHASLSFSMAYWSALCRWGVVRPRKGGSHPTRAEALSLLRREATSVVLATEDGLVPEEMHACFLQLPAPPAEFASSTAPLDFVLTQTERSFLRAQLASLMRPRSTDASLFSRLVQAGEAPMGSMYSKQVRSVADADDRKALLVAKRAARLAAVARANYAALVEEAREADGLESGDRLRRLREKARDEWGDDALRFDPRELSRWVSVRAPAGLTDVMVATQAWLHQPQRHAAELERVMTAVEQSRKGRRAKLGPLVGHLQRRAEWRPDLHAEAQPLHYRWANVRRLLGDFHA